MKSRIVVLPVLFCFALVGSHLIEARGQLVQQPSGNKPVLKPAGSRPGKPLQRTTNPVRKRSGQVAAPTNKTDKQPRWSSLAVTPEIPAAAIAREKARELFERAKALLGERKPQEALPLLKQAETLEPQRYEIHFLLGVTHAVMGRLDDAISSFQKVVKIKPEFARAHAALCRTLAEMSKWMDAVDSCREAVRLEPSNLQFRSHLAELYLLNEQTAEAIALLESANRPAQEDLVFAGTLADAYFADGNYARAADLYERIAANWPAVPITYLRLSGVYDYLERPTDMIKAARKFAELEPNLVLAHLNLGFALRTSGFFEEAITPLDRAVALDGKKGEAFLALGDSHETLGDKENALKNLRLAYQHLPRDPSLAVRLAHSLWGFARLPEAVEPLEWANSVLPNTPEVMRPLGFAYLEVGKYDEGVELIGRAAQISPLPPGFEINLGYVKKRHTLIARFDELLENIRKNPRDIKSRFELAAVYEFKRMPKEREQQYLEIVKIAPTDANYARLGILYADKGDVEKALEPTRKAAELNPHHVYYASLSHYYEKLGRIDDAIQAAKRSVELKPAGVENRLILGDLWLKRGNRQEALREYQEGFTIASGDPRPNFKLAWLYIRMGNREGAFRHYGILKGIAPGNLGNLELSLKAHFGTLR